MSSSAMEQPPMSSLESVEFPSTLTEIGYSAFRSCSSLQYIDIPASVETIEGDAFSEIPRLTIRLNGGPSDISIGEYCFDANDLNLIVPDDYVDAYKEADYWKDIQDLRVISIGDFETNKGFIIDEQNVLVSYVGNYSTVVIPDSVTSIGDNAFRNNMSIKEITIPANVLSIGDYAFSGCINLKTVNFAEESTLSSIGKYAFEITSKLETIVIPSTVTVLSEGLFSFSGIAYISIRSTVLEIGDYAFQYNSNLRAVAFELNESDTTVITKIGEGAFIGCPTLTSFYVPASVTIIGNSAFALSGLAIIMFEADSALEEIGDGAFCMCDALTTITIPASVTSIGGGAFADSGISSILFDENSTIETIGSDAFTLCDKLTAIVLPDSVTEIKEYAFLDSSNLISVTIGSNITNIEANAFNGVSLRIALNIDIYEDDANFAEGWDIIGSVRYGDEEPTIFRITQINWKEAPSNPSEPGDGDSSLTGPIE
jgi:hypothetical protein